MKYNFICNKSKYDADDRDSDAMLCLKMIFNHTNTKLDEKNDKYPNIDGYIELLNSEGCIHGKVTIQVKCYPNLNRGLSKYSIPAYILAYAERMKGEIVLFITADLEEKKIYWKYIDFNYISDCIKKGIQGEYTYHFEPAEIITSDNVTETIGKWTDIYDKRMSLIKDRKTLISEKVNHLSIPFCTIRNYFYGFTDSYIERKEVKDLYDWINSPLKDDGNIVLLIGNAGVGKSVVLKQLIQKMAHDDIPYMAIKSDAYEISGTEKDDELGEICDDFGFLASYNDQAVLIVDQIDSLSQSLSNDRIKLMNYLALINNFARTKYVKDIRIIVSCRKFDLEFDPSLSELKNNKTIELHRLLENDVKSILGLLNKELSEKVSPETIELLRTPQYLDTYCRLYSMNHKILDYNSIIGLYDELWKQVVLFNNEKSLETVLFDIAKKMRDDETLSPYWMITSENDKATKLLASNGIVDYQENKIHFFHQSFYDYVLARYYSSIGRSFANSLLKEHQGLFIRSTIKVMLDYYRGHDDNRYKREIQILLLSDKIRTHIKLLVLNLMGTYPCVKPFEKTMLLKLKNFNEELFFAFVKQINSLEWFDVIKESIKKYIVKLNNDSLYCSQIWLFFFNNVINKPNEVYLMIESIENDITKKETAKRVLWFTKDYSLSIVQKWYHLFYNDFHKYNHIYIENAIDSNIKFACEETGVILKELLSSKVDNKKKNESHYLFFNVCEKLFNKNSSVLYPVLKDVILCTIKKHSFFYYNTKFLSDSLFYGSDTGNNNDQIINWLLKFLKDRIDTDIDFLHNEAIEFFKKNYITTFIIAFQSMAYYPSIFVDDVINLMQNADLLDDLLICQKTRYYVIELLKQIYNYFNKQQKQYYQDFILDFKSKEDYNACKDHLMFSLPLYPYLNNKNRELISTIPDNELTDSLKKLKEKLDRRYKKPIANDKPNYNIRMATFCGGVTNHTAYRSFTKKNWLNSFLTLDGNSSDSNGRWRFLDLRVHAEEFEKCIEESPDSYSAFVKKIVYNEDVKIFYKLYGISGLVKGNYDRSFVFSLFKHIIENPIEKEYSYKYFDIARYLVKEDGEIVDRIIQFLDPIIRSKYKNAQYETSIEDKSWRNANTSELLMAGLNSLQGEAIKVLINICEIKSRQSEIYNLLQSFYLNLCIELQLVVLYYVYHRESFNEELFSKLYRTYLSMPISELMIVQVDALHRYWYYQPEIVLPYIKSILHHKRSQELLSRILFFGYGYEKAKEFSTELLKEVLTDDNELVVSAMIDLAIKHIGDATYHELSVELIRRYWNDKRTEVYSIFINNCDQLPVDEFLLLKEWLDVHFIYLNNQNTFYIFDYLKKCSSSYPIACYNCIKKIILIIDNKARYQEKDIIEILLGIYKYLKDQDDQKYMEEIMDTFDSIMLDGNTYYVNEAIKLIE